MVEEAVWVCDAWVTVLEAEPQANEMVGMLTEQVVEDLGMLSPVWPEG